MKTQSFAGYPGTPSDLSTMVYGLGPTASVAHAFVRDSLTLSAISPRESSRIPRCLVLSSHLRKPYSVVGRTRRATLVCAMSARVRLFSFDGAVGGNAAHQIWG